MNEALSTADVSPEQQPLRFEITNTHPKFFTVTISVAPALVSTLYKEVSQMQQNRTHTHGFARGATPLSYIETTYKNHITNHLTEFLYTYVIKGFLYQELRAKKVLFADDPKVTETYLDPEQGARFTFEFTVPETLATRGWKYYSFKSPKRKNYRDLDRQVEFFLKSEEAPPQKKEGIVHPNDWVCLEIGLVGKEKTLILPTTQHFWLKIGGEEADSPFQELLCGKKIGDQFLSNSDCLQGFFSTGVDTQYLFSITIKDLVHDHIFSFDEFKTKFRLRTNKEMHKKLIEVFSFRNDVSQRQETVEEMFRLLLMHNPLEAPPHLTLRRQSGLMRTMHENPDFHVYRTQKNFEENVRLLAEKQVREAILIDQLAVRENIPLNRQDIKQYLNLLKRPRTREFIYFKFPPSKANGQEIPIHEEVLKRYCLREKTLNYVIYHLTRK